MAVRAGPHQTRIGGEALVKEVNKIIVVEEVDSLVDPVGEEEEMVDIVEAVGRATQDQ